MAYDVAASTDEAGHWLRSKHCHGSAARASIRRRAHRREAEKASAMR
jgi:hypothetical protein